MKKKITDYYDITIISKRGETAPIKRHKMVGFNIYKNGLYEKSLPYLPEYKRL